jgi:hypothetical protein
MNATKDMLILIDIIAVCILYSCARLFFLQRKKER